MEYAERAGGRASGLQEESSSRAAALTATTVAAAIDAIDESVAIRSSTLERRPRRSCVHKARAELNTYCV